ncbi:MAG: hypothetical protein L3K19_07000 [Thermoplasmata archaeon]|nr:hypothetical protein [Thermoplasmata archaeon]
MTNVMVVGGSEETRMLLRGLLRLHRHRVLLESPSLTTLSKIPEEGCNGVLILDCDIAEDAWAWAIESSLRANPGMRAILLTASRGGRIEEEAKRIGIQTLLRRPFAVHELVEAVAGAPPTSPT